MVKRKQGDRHLKENRRVGYRFEAEKLQVKERI